MEARTSMILIRADGSPKTGSGHIMRCMTIAEQLKSREQLCFVTDSEDSVSLIESRGFSVEVLKGCYEENRLEEIDELRQLIISKKAKLLLVDSYLVTEEYFEGLKDIVTLAYLDDMGEKVYPVDIIVNYNVFANESDYLQKYSTQAAECLIGPSYIPIRDEFTGEKYEVRQELKDVLILTGGGDYYNLAQMFMDAFGQKEELKKINFHLVCGYYNNQKEILKKKAERYRNFCLYENVQDIWKLMRKCDCAVTAGGTTVYELCAVGVPIIGYAFADNQHPVMDYMNHNRLAVYCGDYREKGEMLLKELAQTLLDYRGYEFRKGISGSIKNLVDGKGAGRIADALQTN